MANKKPVYDFSFLDNKENTLQVGGKYDFSFLDEYQPEEQNDTVGNGVLGHFVDAAQAGASSVLGGQARFAAEFSPIGKDTLNNIADYLDETARRNTPTQELEGLDYVAQSVGNAVGSGGITMAEMAALVLGAQVAGVGGAGVGLIGAVSKVPGVSRVVGAAKTMASTPFGKMLLANVGGSPLEAASEAGNLITDMREKGYSDQEIRDAALASASYNTAWLTVANAVEAKYLDKIVKAAKGTSGKGFKDAIKDYSEAFGRGAVASGIGEGVEETGQGAIGNIAEGVPIDWEAALEQGQAGAVGGAVLGGVGAAGGRAVNRYYGDKDTDQTAENKQAEQGTTEQPAAAPSLDTFLNAMSTQESGGNYNAENEYSGAFGKYQIMPENWPSWAEEAGLGRDAEQTPENQEIVVRKKLGGYYEQYGPEGAAVAWYAGPTNAQRWVDGKPTAIGENGQEYSWDAPQANGAPSVREYVNSVLGHMGAKGTQPKVADNSSYDAAVKYLEKQMDELEAEEVAEIQDILEGVNGETKEDVIAEAIRRGMETEDTQQVAEAEQTPEEMEQTPEVEPVEAQPLTVENAVKSVSEVTQSVAQNGAEFNQPIQPVATPKVDSLPEVQTTNTTANTDETAKPTQSLGEKQLTSVKKSLNRIANNGQFLGQQISDERINDIKNVIANGSPKEVVAMAKKYKIRIKKELNNFVKEAETKPAQTVKPVENVQPEAVQEQPQTQVEQPAVETEGVQVETPALEQPQEVTEATPKAPEQAQQVSTDEAQPSAQTPDSQQIEIKTQASEKVKTSLQRALKDYRYGKQTKSKTLKIVETILDDASNNREIDGFQYDDLYEEASAIIKGGKKTKATKGATKNGKSESKKSSSKNTENQDVQPEVPQEAGTKQTEYKNEVTPKEQTSWQKAADDLLGADFNSIFDEEVQKQEKKKSEKKKKESAERKADEEIEAIIRDEELTKEADNDAKTDDAIDKFIESMPKGKTKTAFKTYFSKAQNANRRDFCIEVAQKNPKVTINERISPSGKDNSQYFVVYDGIEMPEKISKVEANVIAGITNTKIEKAKKEAKPKAATEEKPKYITEIPKEAAYNFLSYIEETKGSKKRGEYLARLKEVTPDGNTWSKKIRQGVFTDLQNRDGLAEAEWYENNLLKLKGDTLPLIDYYEWMYDTYKQSVKRKSRGDYAVEDNANLSEAELIDEIKRAAGYKIKTEEAKEILDKIIDKFPGTNFSELESKDFKDLIRRAQTEETVTEEADSDKIEAKTNETFTDDEVQAAINATLAAINNSSEKQFQFAGVHAATADVDALDKAKALNKSGKSAQEIYDETGWFLGRDGKWRFEIPDLIENVDYKPLLKKSSVELQEIYDNEQLYKAYPRLAHVKVILRPDSKMGNASALSNTSKEEIVVSESTALLKDKPDISGDARTTLLHEIQHFIQDYEKHSAGGSPTSIRKILEFKARELNNVAAKISNKYKTYNMAKQRLVEVSKGKDVDENVVRRLEQAIDEYEKEKNTDFEADQEAMNRLQTQASKINEYLKQYNDIDLYNMLYGEREATRTEKIAVETAKRNQYLKEGDLDSALLAELAADRYRFLDEANANKNYDKEVIFVFGNEKRNALRASMKDNKEELDDFDANVLAQIIRVGYMRLQQGFDTAKSWRNVMQRDFLSVIDKVAKLMDSVWEFLRKLPSGVSAETKKMLQAITLAGRAFEQNQTAKSTKEILKNRMPELFESLKDFIDPAFAAIRHYPRKNSADVVKSSQENNDGGKNNEYVRMAGADAESSSGRGSGKQLEGTSDPADAKSSTKGEGKTNQGTETVQTEYGNGNSTVSGSGPAVSGEQSNQQSGKQKSDDSQRSSGNTDGGRSGRGSEQGNVLGEGGVREQSAASSSSKERNEKPGLPVKPGLDGKYAGERSKQLNKTNIPIKAGEAKNIAETLPILFKEQVEDVRKIEKRLVLDDKKGMLIANGTGTGKTLTGLGAIKRYLMQGKNNILIVVPTKEIGNNWADEGQRIGIDSMYRITTGSPVSNEVNIITYNSLYKNPNLLKEQWDLIVCDESHNLASGAQSSEESPSVMVKSLRTIAGHSKGFDGWMLLKHGDLLRKVDKLGAVYKKALNEYRFSDTPVQKTAAFNKMNDAQKELDAAKKELNAKRQKEQPLYDAYKAKNKSKVLFLSATPFAYPSDIYIGEGMLFEYGTLGYNGFMAERFGYEVKEDGSVKAPKGSNNANEIAFHDMLVEEGAMSNRRLVIDKDYNRKFVRVDDNVGAEIDKGFTILGDSRNGYNLGEENIASYLAGRFDNYVERLLEISKAKEAVPMIKEYIAQGKKVVLFHDTKIRTPMPHPFKLTKEEISELSPDLAKEYQRLQKEHPELMEIDIGKFNSPIEVIMDAFGEDVSIFNGDINKNKRSEAVKNFNDDFYDATGKKDSSKGNLIMLTSEAGKEGISLHDKTGKYPRVLINIGMPTKPTAAIQIEGRIYRVGQKTNAQFRYLTTGTKMENRAFTERVSKRSRTAENMALGKEARLLDVAFTDGFLEALDNTSERFSALNDKEDAGGKVADRRSFKEMVESMRSRRTSDAVLQAQIEKYSKEEKLIRDEAKRRSILTPENEKAVVAQFKEIFKSKDATKVSDGVYVIELPNKRNIWLDLTTSQAEVLSSMTPEEKRSLKSAANVRTSSYVIRGFYSQELKAPDNGMVDVIHLTEAYKEGTLDHEVFHFVHNVLLPSETKRLLAEYYLQKLKKQVGTKRFLEMTPEERLARVYEIEAEQYRMFTAYDRKPKTPIEKVLYSIKKWLAKFADKFGVNTPFHVFIQVRSGKLFTEGVQRNSLRKAEAEKTAEQALKETVKGMASLEEGTNGETFYSVDEQGMMDGKRTQDDIAATLEAANKRAAEKGLKNSGIIVKKRELTKEEERNQAPATDWIDSPSSIARKYPVFRAFYNIYKKAQDTQEKLRNRWFKSYNDALKTVGKQEEQEELFDLLMMGEYEEKEYSAKELLANGYNANSVKAYTRIRQLLRNIWEAVNDAHRGVKEHNETVDYKTFMSLKKDKFVEDFVVKDPLQNGKYVDANSFKPIRGINYEVRYNMPKVYRSVKPEPMTQEQIDELNKSPYARVVNTKQVDYFDSPIKFYEVTVERIASPIGKIIGYLPHLFEEWTVGVEVEEGIVPIGSGKTLNEAYKIAEKYKKANPGINIFVQPKLFDPSKAFGDGEESHGIPDGVAMSEMEYAKIAANLASMNRLSFNEARAALSSVSSRTSRNRFFGNLRHRKGRTGYNTDIVETVGKYILTSSRYCAMQPAKSTAVPLYERTFKVSFNDKPPGEMAAIIQDYMRYNNGTPNSLERWCNAHLHNWGWWERNVEANYGDRATLGFTTKVNSIVSKATLGFWNPSSALINLLQLMNTVGYIGLSETGQGMSALKRMNLRDKRVLVETGVKTNIGLDATSGFSRRRNTNAKTSKSAKTFGKILDVYRTLSDKGMSLFAKTDMLTRQITVLGAYYKGIDEGMTHKQAIAYAKEINVKANFDYGAADAPGIFRKYGGSLADLFLLFRKYPVKELEVMRELLPVFGKGKTAQKARFWGTYFLISGLLGFPAADWVDDILAMKLGYKPSVLAKAWMFKTFGDNVFTRSLIYGVGSAAGVDISKRAGLADVVPDSNSLIGLAGGVAGSKFVQLVQAGIEMDGIKLIKAWTPAIGHLLEALQGYRTNSKGQVVVRYEGVDRALKAAGFKPVEESITYDMQSAVYAERTRVRNARAEIMQEMAEKQIDGERLTPDDIAQLKKYNITGSQLAATRKKLKMSNQERTKQSLSKKEKKWLEDTPFGN